MNWHVLSEQSDRCFKYTVITDKLIVRRVSIFTIHTVLLTLLIPAVCRTRVTTNSINMTSLATSLPISSVVRAPDRCTGGHGFDSRGLIFSLSHACDKQITQIYLILIPKLVNLGAHNCITPAGKGPSLINHRHFVSQVPRRA